jgi:hypothetical protein
VAGGCAGHRAEGLALPLTGPGPPPATPSQGLSRCRGCATEGVVSPHAWFLALDVAARQACANIQVLHRLYPWRARTDGSFDVVNPTTGALGRRYLVLGQSVIMAALDSALSDRAIQRDFARDPVSWPPAPACRWKECLSV